LVASIHEFRIEFYTDETNIGTVKLDVLSSLNTLKTNNKIMRANGNIDEIATPESVFRIVITFDTNDGNRAEVKTAVVNKLTTLKDDGKIYDATCRIAERLEFQIEELTF